MLLSIGMMVKNEEKYLGKCLQGLRPVINALDAELIIVDTGSTDRTVEIAKKYTSRVYYHDWNGNFGEMRNTVLSYAKGKWFFFLDADEIIDDYADIVDFFRSKRHKKANAAFFLLKNLAFKEQEDSYLYSHALRFFRNNKEFHFKGAVHEQPVFKLPVAQIKASAIHYGYLNDDSVLMEYKFKRNVEILQKELEKDPENVYYWYQLAQSYGMYGDNEKSLDSILKAYTLMKSKESKYRMSVAILLAKGYFGQKRYRKAIEICDEGCKQQEGYFDLYYLRALSHFELGNYKDALSSFELYLEGVEKFHRNEGLVDLSAPYLTARFYEYVLQYVCAVHKKLYQYEQALEYAARITDPNVYKRAIPQIVDIYVEQERFGDLKQLYEAKVTKNTEFEDAFLNALEQCRKRLSSEEQNRWSELFAHELSDYGLLNQIRLLDDSEDISPALVDRIQSLDWSKLHAFYGDLIWALITRNQPIVPILQELPVYKLNVFLEYIAKHNRRYGAVLMNYLQEQELWQTDNIPPEALRVKVLILRSILVFDGLSEDDYEAAFDEYVVNGIPNLMNVYHPDVVENENVKYITTNVDAFLLYMYKAQQCIETDKKKYVRYLRKALESDTQMKKGIEILQKRISQSLNDPQQELEAHKQIIIETIENAINSGDLETATALIDEYESIVGVDAKICSVKSVMLMIGQNWEQAKEVLLKGLNFNEETPDLLFNLGYLYQKQEDYTKSILFYELAKECSNDGRLNNEIEIILQGIRPYSNNKYRNDNENSQRKRVLFVAHIFPPVGGSGVQRTLKYVKYLRNTGWEPIVVTVGRTAYPLKDYSLVTELPGDLKIIRIDEDYSVHDSRIRDLAHIMEEVTSNKELVYNYMADIKVDKSRLKEFCTTPDPYLLWANSVMKELDSLVNINEIDVVYTTSGPYSDHLIGYYLKKRYKLPWVADFRDEWTNNPFAKYDKSSLRYKIEYALERGILQVADKIVVTTPLARENYINGFNLPASKVITITNGYDEDDFTKLNDDNTCKDKFSVFHNGLLYGIRTPITFFKALSEAIKAELIDKDKIEVSFAWTENGKLWIDYCKKLEIEDCVNFVGYLDHKESLQKAMRSDCLLLILGPGKKNKSVYPGKVFEYLRLGKPIMSLSPKGGLVDQLVQEFNAGYNSDFEDINAIKDNLVYFYTKWNEGKLTSNKKLIEVRRFERSNLTNQFACILREVYMKEACAIEKEKILYSL